MSSVLRTQLRAQGLWKRRKVGSRWAWQVQGSTPPRGYYRAIEVASARRDYLSKLFRSIMGLPTWMSRLFSFFRSKSRT